MPVLRAAQDDGRAELTWEVDTLRDSIVLFVIEQRPQGASQFAPVQQLDGSLRSWSATGVVSTRPVEWRVKAVAANGSYSVSVPVTLVESEDNNDDMLLPPRFLVERTVIDANGAARIVVGGRSYQMGDDVMEHGRRYRIVRMEPALGVANGEWKITVLDSRGNPFPVEAPAPR